MKRSRLKGDAEPPDEKKTELNLSPFFSSPPLSPEAQHSTVTHKAQMKDTTVLVSLSVHREPRPVAGHTLQFLDRIGFCLQTLCFS